jgi:hypothetical protein
MYELQQRSSMYTADLYIEASKRAYVFMHYFHLFAYFRVPRIIAVYIKWGYERTYGLWLYVDLYLGTLG